MELPELSSADAARLAGLSHEHFRKLRYAGEGPRFQRMLGRVLYHRQDVIQWMSERGRRRGSRAK